MIRNILNNRQVDFWVRYTSPLLALLLMRCGGGGSNIAGGSDGFANSSNTSEDQTNEAPVIGVLPTSVKEDEAIIGGLIFTDEDTSSLIVSVTDMEPYSVSIDDQNLVRVSNVNLTSPGDVITFTVSVVDNIGQSTEKFFTVEVVAVDETAAVLLPQVAPDSADLVTVELELTNLTSFNSIQFDIIFDENLLDYVEGSLSSDLIPSLIINDDASDEGLIRIGGISFDAIFPSSGELVSLDFNQIHNVNTQIQFVNIMVDDLRLSAETVEVIA